MDTFSLFDCVSPLDFRYYGGDERLFQALSPYVSERARVRYEARVEAALVRVLERRGLCPPEAADAIVRACEEVTPEEVAAEERRIRHNVRALVNAIRARVPYITTTTAALAAAHGILAAQADSDEVKSLQEYHALLK